ncbi:MAG: methylated-DNA--[protein]-cysteine S-methyltransferase, partial [Acidobacteriota bacterium]
PLIPPAPARGLCWVRFAHAPHAAAGRPRLEEDLRGEFPEARIEALEGQASGEAAREPLGGWIRALEEHLRGERPSLDLPLDVRASAFRQRVWRSLQTIPSGETRSYREVAAAIGQPRAARAVAGACAANPVALVIPCHRVIRSGGELGGYRWGEGRKRDLLERERRAREARE